MCKVVLNILIIFGVCFVITKINCEIFSAIEKLGILFDSEQVLITELEKLAEKVHDDYVNRKLMAWKDEHGSIKEADVWRYITNPLNAFLMIKRFTADVKVIEKRFPEETKELLQHIRTLHTNEKDLTGAAEGLLRLQFFYKLKTIDFANGIIDGNHTRSPLSVHDLFTIGEEAMRIDGTDYFALQYLNMVREYLKHGFDVDNEVDEQILILYLININRRVGNNGGALEMLKELKIKFPETAALYAFTEKTLIENLKEFDGNNYDPFSNHFVHDGTYSDSKDRILNSQICRGDVSKSTSKLYCRYVSTNPFSTLARFKVEEANLDPYIVLFIDVVSKGEIKFLKEASKLKQQPGINTLANLVSNHQVAQVAWHYENEHSIFRKLSRRIEDMTGLSQTTAEPLQTANYGIGGHYAGHWDCSMKRDKRFENNGNRIATVLFYLSNVEKGGGTVFPYLKLHISSRKRAALFWHNLSSSGACDFLTRHSACPVLLGSKWVANAWIREHGNEFRRPCVPGEIYDDAQMEKFLFDKFY